MKLLTKILISCGLSAPALIIAMFSTLTFSNAANASAFGCQYIGGFGFTFKGLSLTAPKGFLCHDIKGSKKYIDREIGTYSAAPSLYGYLTGKVCNWRIDFVYTNAANGSTYLRDRGPTNNSCSYLPIRTQYTDKNLKYYGKACAQLYVNGVYRSSQCHNITG